MKKLLAAAALVLAFAPLAQAQIGSATLAGHPDARNDRSAFSINAHSPAHHGFVQVRHVKHHRHLVKHPRRHGRIVRFK